MSPAQTRADELASLLRAALARAGHAQAEVWARVTERGFARFSGGELSQHMQLVEPLCAVRVAEGRRVAELTLTELSEDAIVRAVAGATEIARSVPEDPTFPGFASASEPLVTQAARHASSTAGCDAEQRVARLTPLLERVKAAGLTATGVLDTSESLEAVATTGGLVRAHAGSVASFKIWALERASGHGASGFGSATEVDVERLDLQAETERAVRDALDGHDPISLPAGAYDVVLEPAAVAELLEWLALIALTGRELHQGTSPLAGRIGEPIGGPALDLFEDPHGDLSLCAPFDREGTTRRRVQCIERGVARAVLTDRGWAARLGSTSTGNASPPSSFDEGGPASAALVMAGGDAPDVDQLIGGVERGLHVRRLHYVNGMLEPRRALMTGLTRDGTFLIERGARTRAVGSLRFTDSLLEAIARVDGATRGRTLVPNWWSSGGSVAAPALRIRGLCFSSGSQPVASFASPGAG